MRAELGLELGCWGREAERKFTEGEVWVGDILTEETPCRKARGVPRGGTWLRMVVAVGA